MNGLDTYGQTTGSKLALSSTQAFAISGVNYFVEYNSLKNEIDVANFTAKMQWFGGGGIYTNESGTPSDVVVNEGISDPAVFRAMLQWQTEGIQSFTKWNDDDIDNISEIIPTKTKDPEIQMLCMKILKNEYNIFDDSYEIEQSMLNEEGKSVTEKVRVQTEFGDFEKAILTIQRSGTDVNVQDKFNDVVKGNQKYEK